MKISIELRKKWANFFSLSILTWTSVNNWFSISHRRNSKLSKLDLYLLQVFFCSFSRQLSMGHVGRPALMECRSECFLFTQKLITPSGGGNATDRGCSESTTLTYALNLPALQVALEPQARLNNLVWRWYISASKRGTCLDFIRKHPTNIDVSLFFPLPYWYRGPGATLYSGGLPELAKNFPLLASSKADLWCVSSQLAVQSRGLWSVKAPKKALTEMLKMRYKWWRYLEHLCARLVQLCCVGSQKSTWDIMKKEHFVARAFWAKLS